VEKDETHPQVERASSPPIDQARRDALRRIGKYGAYTAPTLLAMMVAEKALAKTGV
jgi:hypothetical protein